MAGNPREVKRHAPSLTCAVGCIRACFVSPCVSLSGSFLLVSTSGVTSCHRRCSRISSSTLSPCFSRWRIAGLRDAITVGGLAARPYGFTGCSFATGGAEAPTGNQVFD